ncbi:hypothetical protein HUW63_02575 [Myxococcus sp. AM001]|nr:hypothetical protein [Myxococcus sp. AM001]
MSHYFVLSAGAHPDGCVLDQHPSSFEHIWQATEGIPLGNRFPPHPLGLPMSRRMGGKATFDIVTNTLGYLIVSERIRDVLERHATTAIEFLPIELINHKGRRDTGPFFIANILGQIDCVHLGESVYEESALAPGEFSELTRLVLDASRVDTARNIFRISRLPRVILVREDLATRLKESGATGLALIPLESEVSL